MNIQINTGHNIEGSLELNSYIKESFTSTFDRYENALTRIEVHLTDENAGKSGPNDKRCLLEARLSNHKPLTVSHEADTVHKAISAATNKLLRSLDKTAAKMTNHKSPSEVLFDSHI
jgi:ribosomal subunit interface protein